MTNPVVQTEHAALKALLGQEGIERVAIIDDAFDSVTQTGLSSAEAIDLWAELEFVQDACDEIAKLGFEVNSADELTGELIDQLLLDTTNCPAFTAVWDQTLAGQQRAAALRPLISLADYLRQHLQINVREFNSSAEPEKIIKYEPQLVFLDWFLGNNPSQSHEGIGRGGEPPDAVLAAVERVEELLRQWPSEKPKPLVVLMSSIIGVESYASEFCRRSGILRGMFFAVPKTALSDSVSLRFHMRWFAMSLPYGRRVQNAMDTLRTRFEIAKNQFFERISDLTLSDYSYIQSLSLQNDGQPLGDYLLSLFSDYLGQLLFAEGLHGVRADLDAMTFGEAIPNLGPPSDRLAEVFHSSLFDTSVGALVAHPLAANESEPPALTLGDVLRRQVPDGTTPDLYLVINAQCDLAFRRVPEGNTADASQSILLLPGFLNRLGGQTGRQLRAKTELYQQDGENYWIRWDTKQVRAIDYGKFSEWICETGFQREARLRLPFALELQRAFAADLTRMGSPVMPPIYRLIEGSLLRPDSNHTVYEAGDVLNDGDAFLMLTEAGQQCVFDPSLLLRLKKTLDERLNAMRDEAEAQGEHVGHLGSQIAALEKAIDDDSEWWELQKPFKLPTNSTPKRFIKDRVLVLNGGAEGDACDSTVIVAVSLNLSQP